MLTKLRQYYIENGISALSFQGNAIRCKHYEICSHSKDGKKKRPFVTAKEAFVSTGYELHKIPRILVVSLDPKFSPYYAEPENRTLEAVRNNEEISPTENYYEWKINTHWKKTYDCLFILLKPYIQTRDRREIRHYFAHTNSAKCHDKPGSEQASDELFVNCDEYLTYEISILDPDVVITQGDAAKFSFMHEFHEVEEWALGDKCKDLRKLHPIVINSHISIWIQMNHPCRHDNLYHLEDEVNFQEYSTVIEEFWTNH